MAVLLVGIAVMSILLSVAMPVWHQQMQREKEAELIFRGEQYQHAIILFQRKYGAALPPNVQVLLDQKFLRKKYKDPITGKDFQPIYQANAAQFGAGGATAPPGQPPAGTGNPTGTATGAPGSPTPATSGIGASGTPGAAGAGVGGIGRPGTVGPQGGLIGVISTSTAQSIRIFNGYDHYNQWAFIYSQYVPPPGPGAQPPAQLGQPGQPGQPRVPTRPSQPGQPGGSLFGQPPQPGGPQPGR
ncbi:MAG: type II secretion system protein [Acidobacteriota bacterium]|nr:type II secretion system protein [Acidobacteriota bacterium]